MNYILGQVQLWKRKTKHDQQESVLQKQYYTNSWFKVHLTAFARVWSSSVKEKVALLWSPNAPCSID